MNQPIKRCFHFWMSSMDFKFFFQLSQIKEIYSGLGRIKFWILSREERRPMNSMNNELRISLRTHLHTGAQCRSCSLCCLQLPLFILVFFLGQFQLGQIELRQNLADLEILEESKPHSLISSIRDHALPFASQDTLTHSLTHTHTLTFKSCRIPSTRFSLSSFFSNSSNSSMAVLISPSSFSSLAKSCCTARSRMRMVKSPVLMAIISLSCHIFKSFSSIKSSYIDKKGDKKTKKNPFLKKYSNKRQPIHLSFSWSSSAQSPIYAHCPWL